MKEPKNFEKITSAKLRWKIGEKYVGGRISSITTDENLFNNHSGILIWPACYAILRRDPPPLYLLIDWGKGSVMVTQTDYGSGSRGTYIGDFTISRSDCLTLGRFIHRVHKEIKDEVEKVFGNKK